MGKPKTKYWGQFWGKTDDDDDWEVGGKDSNSLDPERNKGKMGYMPEGWTDEQRKKVEHVVCPACAATVYASGYMVRDKCDVCWTMFPDPSWNMSDNAEAKKANRSVQGTHSAYSGSYTKSLTSFAKMQRSDVEDTPTKEEHLLSTVRMAAMPTVRFQEEQRLSTAASSGENSTTSDYTKHVTKNHKKTKTDADEYLSSTSEAYTHEIVQDIELFARAVELVIEADSDDKRADLRAMVETMMGEFGAATGHKIGDDWFLRDTSEEAKAIQERAGFTSDQPMYGAALYGDEGEGGASSQYKSSRSMKLESNSRDTSTSLKSLENIAKIRESIRQGIKKAGVAGRLNDVSTEVAVAKDKDRMSIMQEKLMPIISEIIEQQGGESLNENEANDAIGEALGGMVPDDQGKDTKYRAAPADRGDGTSDDSRYRELMRNYMNDVGDEIRKEREVKAKKKSREDKWSPTAKNIAKAYGHDASSGSSYFDSREPLIEFPSKSPKSVPLSFKGQQMLEAIENQRRVTWEESGDVTDRMVELNFGNLKVFRQEDTYSPQLIIGVDVSGSTGCIHDAGNNHVSKDAGSLMWEIAATVSSAGGDANTLQYAYHSTHQGFLTVVEVPKGMRPLCYCESGHNDYYAKNNKGIAEHGGGTPELAMLHYLNDKAQLKGDLNTTTVILIVDGQPDDAKACKKMSEELVKAGVQFGVVVCGEHNYFNESDIDDNYYNASVAVKVETSADIDTAIPKLMSLIQARGLV
jgi:hypothetical protein